MGRVLILNQSTICSVIFVKLHSFQKLRPKLWSGLFVLMLEWMLSMFFSFYSCCLLLLIFVWYTCRFVGKHRDLSGFFSSFNVCNIPLFEGLDHSTWGICCILLWRRMLIPTELIHECYKSCYCSNSGKYCKAQEEIEHCLTVQVKSVRNFWNIDHSNSTFRLIHF